MKKPLTQMEKEKQQEQIQYERDYHDAVKKYIPDLQDTPYVKPCRQFFGLILGGHKVKLIKGGFWSHHEIWMCIKCGYIEAGWGYVSMSGGGSFYTHHGYADPNRVGRNMDIRSWEETPPFITVQEEQK